jgi:hypothetical protein
VERKVAAEYPTYKHKGKVWQPNNYRKVSLQLVVGETFPAFWPLDWMDGQWIMK